MSNKKEPPQPVIGYCCGSYCSEAGCCRFTREPRYDPKQGELLPDDINIKGRFYDPEFTWRGD